MLRRVVSCVNLKPRSADPKECAVWGAEVRVWNGRRGDSHC